MLTTLGGEKLDQIPRQGGRQIIGIGIKLSRRPGHRPADWGLAGRAETEKYMAHTVGTLTYSNTAYKENYHK